MPRWLIFKSQVILSVKKHIILGKTFYFLSVVPGQFLADFLDFPKKIHFKSSNQKNPPSMLIYLIKVEGIFGK